MRDLSSLDNAIAAIDAANADDPNTVNGEPLARWQGQRASRWLDRLTTEPSTPLRLAVRAHHLRRWEIARSEYPDGRAGYLRWRRDNKAHQAAVARTLLLETGIDDDDVERVTELLGRRQLGSDPETQLLEDAACLVFLETQFDQMVEQLDHDHLVNVVAKTLAKMSPQSCELALGIGLEPEARSILESAIAQSSTDD